MYEENNFIQLNKYVNNNEVIIIRVRYKNSTKNEIHVN